MMAYVGITYTQCAYAPFEGNILFPLLLEGL